MRRRGAAAIDALEVRLGHRFADRKLLDTALTHPSAARQGQAHYQRLEFLGDRVLGLTIADLLFRTFPRATEGEMSRQLAALVRKETCAKVAERVGLGDFVRIAGAQSLPDGGRTTNILGDLCEALIAALYLDGGMDVARAFVEAEWRGLLDRGEGVRRDPKTALQEWAHTQGYGVPRYEIVDRWGPAHETVFQVSALVEGLESGTGTGRSRRDAEKEAATAILVRERVWRGISDDG
ncbi:MAG: ribonuclease III [Bauldia sp.]|nr:ribonuclease III [Bauldia sp.]